MRGMAGARKNRCRERGTSVVVSARRWPGPGRGKPRGGADGHQGYMAEWFAAEPSRPAASQRWEGGGDRAGSWGPHWGLRQQWGPPKELQLLSRMVAVITRRPRKCACVCVPMSLPSWPCHAPSPHLAPRPPPEWALRGPLHPPGPAPQSCSSYGGWNVPSRAIGVVALGTERWHPVGAAQHRPEQPSAPLHGAVAPSPLGMG